MFRIRCVCSMLTYGAETWAMKVGVFQKLQATEENAENENDLQSDTEGQSGEFSDCIKSGSGQFRGAFEAEKVEVIWTYCKKR